jgi:hypothetical protein
MPPPVTSTRRTQGDDALKRLRDDGLDGNRTQQAVLRRKTRKHRLIDCVGAMRDARDIDGDAGTVGHVESRKLGDPSLLDKCVRPQHTFENDLCLGRQFQIDDLTFDEA